MSQVWFITGSSRGLGRSIAEAALAAGHRVVATARNPQQLDDLVTRYGEAVYPLTLDVTDYAQAVRTIEAAIAHFGRIDVVVNNAGYGDLASVEDVRLEEFKAQIDTNFYGVVHVTKAVIPFLRQQGSGHIFQVSSIGGRLASVGLTAYQAAKWAVGGFSLGVAQEVAPFGVKVTVLEPGGMRTDWAGDSMTIPPISEPYQQTVGVFADMLRKMSGSESSDPDKVAAIVLGMAQREDAPTRLLIGADSAQYALLLATNMAESDQQWHDISISAEAIDAEPAQYAERLASRVAELDQK
ncbi:SDR family NAD(P)-dependent oxidoreductase [Aeromonas caviae]|uniref:SDR family NAD(P)-dependent oxidoreductase n=1 Tax=Aeromonas TaxID=642 RepID=UPI0006707C74|nr:MULTISPECIES: SDR family NAD(P)-dependent oxidoreductase [Aeromonas]KMY26266.1 oxidoreductase [Aeromonas caviae]MBL0499232.1 SDR family NAD(P)-dependent oxidoreductase [Aeromonas caviae]MCK0186019.1 SDR family NAD(P)-dependent oxidoreductase [Aeromonas hydrophila]MCR3938923.1 SDR family NAD(P)-dependent oxidoreductase [Aeromonas caviae]QSO23913.1 SDR family NAD(P)-dependent oxidoreductase [Aeromonas caviae]